MKKFWWIALTILSAALLLGAFLYRRGGALDEVNLPTSALAKVNEIRIQSSDGFLHLFRDKEGVWHAASADGDFEPDPSRVNDFLHILNLWEVEEMVSDSAVRAWEAEGGNRQLKIRVKAGRRRVFSKNGFFYGGDFFLAGKGGTALKIFSPWQASSWKDFLSDNTAVWHNRILIDLDYFEIASVRVQPLFRVSLQENGYWLEPDTAAGSVPSRLSAQILPERQAQAYFSAFKQVYFDLPADSIQLGPPLYTFSVCEKSGRLHRFQVHTKLTAPQTPDIFKAYVVKGSREGDTVELSYVVLDKMLKINSGF